MSVHYSIVIKGKVQGVCYRASAKHKAEELGITGFLKTYPMEVCILKPKASNPI